MSQLYIIRAITLLLFLLGASSLRAQTNFMRPIDTMVRAEEDSLDRVDLFTRSHPPKDFLGNDFAFGGTLGTPGGLNLIAERYADKFGIRIVAGVFPFIAGYQGGLCYVVQRNSHRLLEITMMYTRSHFTGIDGPSYWNTGVGLGIAGNAGGFFFELGTGHTWKKDEYGYTESNPTFINSWPMTFQIGYVH